MEGSVIYELNTKLSLKWDLKYLKQQNNNFEASAVIY